MDFPLYNQLSGEILKSDFFSPGVTTGMGRGGGNYMGCRIMSIQLNYKKAHIDWINCIGELSKNQKNLFLANSKWPPREHNSWYQAAKQ